ncbi:MAG TPA: DUF1549 and DUF1553 domain-containing protein, partial [Bryobacteraceae bacterium]
AKEFQAMKNIRRSLLCLLLLPGVAPLRAAPARSVSDSRELTTQIDRLIEAQWKAQSAQPAARSDDAEFHRRVYLDLTGRIPAASDVYAFLSDKSADKRSRLVESLLDSPRYAAHFANVWRDLLLPQDNGPQVRSFRLDLEAWLRQQFRDNVGYDRMVRELLTTDVASDPDGEEQPAELETPRPVAFYRANQLRPENLAAATARLFLGVKLECAQCHNHPFAPWKQQQFWEFAAFFAGLEVKRGPGGRIFAVRDFPDRHTLHMAGSGKEVAARFLEGSAPKWTPAVSTRGTLAAWLTAEDNPYFARNAVNRLWSHFFGIGLVQPVDDFGGDNDPSHPELLDELARQFAAHDFDMKFLIRAITASRAYQLSSVAPKSGAGEPRLFNRMLVKGLGPEQLFDSIALATDYREPDRAGSRAARRASPRDAFLTRFAVSSEERTEQQTSILQVLALMNGAVVADATGLERGRTLRGIAEAPWLDSAGRVKAVYMATLSRPPRPAELALLVPYVEDGGPTRDRKRAIADVLWAVLNSSEFLCNH